MNDREVPDAVGLIDSIDSSDLSTADVATCEAALSLLRQIDQWLDDAKIELSIRAKPPVCSIHRHTPVRRMGA